MRERFVTFFDPAQRSPGRWLQRFAGAYLNRVPAAGGARVSVKEVKLQLEVPAPLRDTDFIFAVLGRATWLCGRNWRHSVLHHSDRAGRGDSGCGRATIFGRYIAVGVAVTLFVQSFINIGMNIGLMPITGLTLPLVSYGRNSLVVTLLMLGVLLSVGSLHPGCARRAAADAVGVGRRRQAWAG